MNISKGLLIPTLLALLSACGGGGGGSSAEASKVNTPVAEDNGTVFIAKRFIQSGDFCANGGIEIDMGIDVNINGLLDLDEITKTERVCNGLDGLNGQDGLSGQSSLVSLTPSVDESCPYGGTDINVGADTNANGVLDSQEITGSTLICHTAPEVTEEFGLSAKGKISGALNLPIAPAAKNQSASTIQPFAVTSQTGELWLTPNSIVAAIQADQTATDQAQQPTTPNSLVAPVIEAIKVPVNPDGTFEVEVPAGTNYELTYITVDGTEGIQIGDLAVEPNTETPVTIESADLQATGSVSVKLQSLATGTALQNVNIVLLNGGINMQTDESGDALLENLAPGQYTLQAHIDGYVSKTFSFNVVSGATTDLGALELNNQRGRASGTVTANVLETQENIVVYARDAQGSIYTTLTDSNGIFTFNALPVGDGYSFIALANDFNSNKQDGIKVELGKTASVGNIELLPIRSEVGSITGFAKFAEYQNTLNAHAGIVVSVEGTDKEAITSRDGAYIINGLSSGKYTLNFTDSNHKTTTLQNVLVAKTTSSNIEPQSLVSLTGSLTGKVVDGSGLAIANATLLIKETGVTVQTDSNGIFTFTDIYTGDFTVLVNKDGYQGFSTIVKVQADTSKDLGSLNIDAYSIAGTVSLPNKADNSGALVSIKGTGLTAVTDSNGNFKLSGMPAGQYELQVSLQGHRTESISISLSSEQPNVSLNNTVEMAMYSIRGKVNVSNTADNSAVTVSIIGTSLSTQTGTEGNFSLSGMAAGNYELQVSLPGHQTKKINVNLSPEQPAAVLSNDIDLVMYSLSGKVDLLNSDDNSSVTVTLFGTSFSTQTDADGNFTLTEVPLGNYKLLASKTGYQNQETLISISSDNPVAVLSYTLDLLEAVGKVQGVVTLNNRVAHGGVTVFLVNTEYSTLTDNLGNWSLTIPVGNYGSGISYSKDLYQNQIISETVTVTNKGEYSAYPQTLIQNSMILVMPVTSVGSCSQLEVRLQGISSNVVSFDKVLPVNNGEIRTTVPYGEYRLETRCKAGGFETLVQNITLNDEGNGQLIANIQAVELRESFVVINNGSEFTNTSAVTLTLGSTTAAEMKISGDTTATGWIPFANNYSLALSAGQGNKTVRVEYRDINALSLGTKQDSIIVDSEIAVNSFTATGATTKGDTLLVTLDLKGDVGADVKVSLPGLFSNYSLLDHGVNGDNVANDGIYSRKFIIDTSIEINSKLTATITDKAGNTVIAETTANVVTSTPPGIFNIKISSNIATQVMNLAFDTDEATTSSISWGTTAENLTNSQIISDVLTPNHNTLLTGLSSSELTFYQISVTDAAGNITTKVGKNKLAPAQVENVIAQPGDLEIGVVWNPNEHPYTAGYRVYRSEDNANYTLVNPDKLLKGSYYIDASVQNGTQYFYKVSAVDRDGNEGIKSDVVDAISNLSLAGPTEITDDELWGEHVWIASRSPYIVNKDVTTRHKARLRALPGTNIQLDSTNGRVDFHASDVGDFWLMGETGNPVVVEQVGSSYSGQLNTRGQTDKNEVWLTEEVDPITRYTYDYYPLSGDFFRYVELKQEHSLTIHGSKLVGFQVDATDVTTLQMDLLVGGNLKNTQTSINAGRDLNIEIDLSSNTTTSVSYLTHSNITGFQSSDRISYGEVSSSFAENNVYENIRVSGQIRNSRLKNMRAYSSFESVTESVIESTDGCNGVRIYNPRNVVWLDKTLSELKACGVTNLVKYLPFLTSEDSLHDQDNDGIPDQVDHDSDNDGFSDYQELTSDQYYDPFDPNSKPDDLTIRDHDGDNIPDVDDTDNDNDGISDVDELALGTSSYWVDSDGDGVPDKSEIDNGFDPLNKNNTPLVGTRVGIDLTADKYKDSLNRTVMANFSAYLTGYSEDMTYFYRQDSTLKCFLCIPGKNQKIYAGLSGMGGSFEYLNLFFEYGNSLTFVNDTATGNSNFTLNKSQLVNLHHSTTISIRIDNSAMYYSEVNGNGNGRFNYIYKSILLGTGDYGGLIKSSRLKSASANSQVIDSHYTIDPVYNGSGVGGLGSIFRNSAITNTTDRKGTVGNANTYYYDTYVHNTGPQGTIIRSDIEWTDFAMFGFTSLPSFLSSSYLSIDGSNILSVGTPSDNLGDGVRDTVIDFTDLAGTPSTLTVDGVASPQSAPYFPSGADSVILLNDIGVQ